ncbi:MAG: helix-turn-helix domain-containing protein [Ignavibacterium sp.]|nr:helix-turn-helix domain-containing protein [Ignavibacterium sp.]MDW8376043.1 helix-turn-helix domain-containing protein [Ignavibacteriales bacterium]
MINHKELIAMYRAGISRDQIANRYRISLSTVTNILNKYKIPINDYKRKNNEDWKIICKLYINKKKTRQELAKMFNTKLSNITSYLYKKDIKLWDVERSNRKRKNRKVNKKYFSWQELKDNIILAYNK